MIRLPPELTETIQQGGTLVVPSRQRAHAARLAHAAAQMSAGRRVWKSPDILSLDAWLTREIERLSTVTKLPRLLTPAEDWLLWRQCTTEATAGLDLVNRGALSEGLRRSSALAADFDIDTSNIAGARGTEPTLLRDVHRAFDERCRALGAVSLSSLAGALAQAGVAGGLLRFDGFLQLTPRTRVIAGARGASHGVSAARATPRALLAADEWEELEAIAHWCAERIARQPDARILVVVPGAPGTRERLATLIRQAVDPRRWVGATGPRGALGGGDDRRPVAGGLHRESTDSLVAVEGGKPLTTVPAIQHALSTLLWLSGTRGEFQEVSEWLRAPYWSLDRAGSRSRLDLWLRDLGRMRLSLQELASVLRDAPSECSESARELQAQFALGSQILSGGAASPRDWSQRFREVLNAFGWPGDRPRGSADQQNVVRFHELLDEFGQLAAASRSMTRDQAVQCLADLAARTSFQSADDDPSVTISPVLAAPVAQYDALWVAGLHSEAFPQPVQPDPFLPLAAQVAKGVPAASAAGRLAEAQALLQSWQASTDDLVLSTAMRSEDLELLPSPLLRPWLTAGSTADPAGRTRASAWLPTRLRREGWLETLDDSKGVDWPATRALPAGTRSFELQNLCPFRAYAELRLGSTPLDEPEPGVEATSRGILLHAALSRLWSQFRDSRTLFGTFELILDATIADCVDEAAKETFEPGTLHSLSVVRECRRATRLIRELLALERERAPFQVQSTEHDTKLHIAGAVARMRIDRIDVLESGGRAILDYKSGRRATADWYGDRPSHPQLLAYLAALGDDVVAMATVHVNAREVRFEGIAETRELLPNVKGVERPPNADDARSAWEIRRAEWLRRLEDLAKAFLSGNAVIDPKPGACEHCHVSSVCRISDRGRNDPGA